MFTSTSSMEATIPIITPQENSNNNNLTFPTLLKPLYLTHQNRLEKSPELRQAFAYFIPPDTTASPGSSAREPLDDTAKRFLDQLETSLFLLIGDSGGGKSVFANHLEKTLWEKYFLHQGRAPLFIELKSLAQIPAGENFLIFHLKKCGYSLEEIESLRTKFQWVFIFDGFDEMSGALKETNLYQMGHLAQWQALTLITCRHEYLKGDYAKYFTTDDPNNNNASLTRNYLERFIAGFSPSQIETYIQQRVKIEAHLQRFKNISNINDIVTNPLVLRMVADIIPELETTHTLTLNQIYTQFTDRWFEREKERLYQAQHLELPKSNFRTFCKSLAFAMFMEGTSEVNYVPFLLTASHNNNNNNNNNNSAGAIQTQAYQAGEEWELFFSNRDPSLTRLREASPLRCLNDSLYSFFHKSFMEYFAALFIFEELLLASQPEPEYTGLLLQNLTTSPFNQRLLSGKLAIAIVTFLAEMIQAHPSYEALTKRLIKLAQASKGLPAFSTAASNALTLLAAARVCLSGIDFSYIYAPDANLYGVVLDGANLQGAYLRRANLAKVFLKDANLKEADLTGVMWGEKPVIQYDGFVNSIAYSPNGRYRAVAVENKIKIDGLHSGMQLTLTGHKGEVSSVAWSLTGQLASGSEDNIVILWNIQIGYPQLKLTGHTNGVTSVAWSSMGVLASGSHDSTAILWDLQTRQPQFKLTGHTDSVTSVAWSSMGVLASGSLDCTVILWDLQTRQPPFRLKGHTDSVTSVAWSSMGVLASGSLDCTVILWNLQTRQPQFKLLGHTNWVKNVVWSPTGQLASGSSDHTVILWDLQTHQPQFKLLGHKWDVNSVAWSTTGKLASGSWDNTVILWNIQTRQPQMKLPGHTNDVTSVAWSPTGQLASGSADNTAILWDLQTGQPQMKLSKHTNEVMSVSWSATGQLASGNTDNTVILWDLQTCQPQFKLRGHKDFVTNVAWSHTGVLASGSYDHTVILWNLQTHQPQFKLLGHTNWVTSVAWSTTGILASGSYDHTVILWDLQTRQPQMKLMGHTSAVTSVAWSPKGELASGSWDETVILWNIKKGRPQFKLTGHTNWVTSVAWSPTGQLVSGSKDSVILWDIQTGKPRTKLSGYLNYINGLAWYENDQHTYLATGSTDHAIKVWERVAHTPDEDIWHLRWSSHPLLILEGCQIQGALGLTLEQKELLQQKNAVGEPAKLAPTSLASFIQPPIAFTHSLFDLLFSKLKQELPQLKPLNTKLLLEMLANDNLVLPSHFSAQLQIYLNTGGNPNIADPCSERSLLWWSVKHANVACVKLLLQAGADANAKNRVDNTAPLHLAAQQSNADLVQLLLQHHAYAHILDHHSCLPSDYWPKTPASENYLKILKQAEREDLQKELNATNIQSRLGHLQRITDKSLLNEKIKLLQQEIESTPLRPSKRKLLLNQLQNFLKNPAPLPVKISTAAILDARLELREKINAFVTRPDPYFAVHRQLQKLLHEQHGSLPSVQQEALFVLQKHFMLPRLHPHMLLNWDMLPKGAKAYLLNAQKPLKLKNTDAFFTHLNARINAIESFLKYPETNETKLLYKLLEEVLNQDRLCQTALCQQDVKLREQALQPVLILHTVEIEGHQLTPESQSILYKLIQDTRYERDSSLNRAPRDHRHLVASFQGVHLKPHPDVFAYERLVTHFCQRMHIASVTPNELGQLYVQDIFASQSSSDKIENEVCWPLSLSKTVEGPTFNDLPHAENGVFSYLQKTGRLPLEPISSAHQSLFAMLFKLYDGKLGNYIAMLDTVSKARGDKPVLRSPMGVDNDLVLDDEIIEQENGEHICDLHFFAWMDPLMDDPLSNTPTSVRDHWLQQKEKVLLKTLEDLNDLEALCQLFLKKGIFTRNQLEKLNLPIRFEPGKITALYKDFKRLQTILRDPEIKTLNDVLKRLMPLTYAFYQGWLEINARQSFDGRSHYFGAINELDQDRRTIQEGDKAKVTLEEIARTTNKPEIKDMITQGLAQLSETQRHKKLLSFQAMRTQSLAATKAELLQAFEFPMLTFDERERSKHLQSKLIKTVTGLETCTLKHWLIKDKVFEILIKQNDHLSTLTLIDCPNITLNALKKCIEQRPLIHLIIGACHQLKPNELFELVSLHQEVSLYLKTGKTICIKTQGQLNELSATQLMQAAQDPDARDLCQMLGHELPSLSEQIKDGKQEAFDLPGVKLR